MPVYLSINVRSCVELKIPKLELRDGLIIIFWSNNGSPGPNGYATHFTSSEEWMLLQRGRLKINSEIRMIQFEHHRIPFSVRAIHS